jgi:hypothetical protein
VLKRLLVHAGAFNLGLWMRTLFGIGTPRGLQGRAAPIGAGLSTFLVAIYEATASNWAQPRHSTRSFCSITGLVTATSVA